VREEHKFRALRRIFGSDKGGSNGRLEKTE
jgi:hypothetical protein